MPPVMPFVHMNGTSAEELLQVREDAYSAISEALDKLRQMAPNGRDYYPVPGSMEKAVQQHQRRMKALSDIMTELEEEATYINQNKRK